MLPRTPEHAEKIAVQNRGKIASPEFRQKMSEVTKGENNAFFGKTHTEESKNKISVANKGRKRTTPVSEATRFKLSLVNRGRIPSEETRKKIGEKSKNREFTNNDAVICLNNNTIYTSITKAAKALSVDRHNVSDVCNGKREEIKGFKFKFVEGIQREQSLSK